MVRAPLRSGLLTGTQSLCWGVGGGLHFPWELGKRQRTQGSGELLDIKKTEEILLK